MMKLLKCEDFRRKVAESLYQMKVAMLFTFITVEKKNSLFGGGVNPNAKHNKSAMKEAVKHRVI